MKHPPKLVCSLCFGHNSWVVGSAAEESGEEPRDWDVMVPFSEWYSACFLIPSDAKPNTFGGWKCNSEGKIVDVWPGDLGNLFTYSQMKIAWHPKSGVRVSKI